MRVLRLVILPILGVVFLFVPLFWPMGVALLLIYLRPSYGE